MGRYISGLHHSVDIFIIFGGYAKIPPTREASHVKGNMFTVQCILPSLTHNWYSTSHVSEDCQNASHNWYSTSHVSEDCQNASHNWYSTSHVSEDCQNASHNWCSTSHVSEDCQNASHNWYSTSHVSEDCQNASHKAEHEGRRENPQTCMRMLSHSCVFFPPCSSRGLSYLVSNCMSQRCNSSLNSSEVKVFTASERECFSFLLRILFCCCCWSESLVKKWHAGGTILTRRSAAGARET